MLQFAGPFAEYEFLGLVRTLDTSTETFVVVQVTSEALRDKFAWQGSLADGVQANLSAILDAANCKHKPGEAGPVRLGTDDFD